MILALNGWGRFLQVDCDVLLIEAHVDRAGLHQFDQTFRACDLPLHGCDQVGLEAVAVGNRGIPEAVKAKPGRRLDFDFIKEIFSAFDGIIVKVIR
jgi:hypothetical protein